MPPAGMKEESSAPGGQRERLSKPPAQPGSPTVRDDRVALDPLMRGDGAEDRTKRSESQRRVIWNREEASCHQEDFVADKVKPDSFGPWPIKEERGGRLQQFLAQLVPRVPFGEDAFREAFGAITTIGLLDHLEYQLSHTSMIRHEFA
jgi:hypothetical protein